MPSSEPVVYLRDTFGRIADDLRISVTDRCNFRCVYCMPAAGLPWLARDDVLSFEEIVRVTRILVDQCGVRTIRLTGGEPLVRKGIEDLTGMIAGIDGDLDIAMTTNGILLEEKAAALRSAGLKRLNVSLDTLHSDRFKDLARRDALDRVLRGLGAARAAGFSPIKLNMVVMRGRNDDEILDFARLARSEGYEVRFIEFMPLDADGIWSMETVVASREIIEAIDREFALEPVHDQRPAPATRYRFRDGAPGGIGVIPSVSDAFCKVCNRIRLTAEGHLRTCLFSIQEHDVKALLRGGASDPEIRDFVVAAVWQKEEGHKIGQADFVRPGKTMSQIGG
ncbi:MAG: GTP 3',8-cyclase MoaA [Chloroflexi bacterium]|nr:MAG: GTP 3',8-cyclase MoaA [Chloroflexota bacterium]TMD84473.1 MAG: GTP 3',8-cyclase MoaA [Chloroflexota bacterium]